MFGLNLPSFEVKIQKTEDGLFILDRVRRKYVALTPEEWVRQHFVNYLITEKGYPQSLTANEVSVKLNSLNRRCDTVIYNNNLVPLLICEYKNPNIEITQSVFNQIARYNLVLRVSYLIVSNGITHYGCKMNYESQSFEYLKEIPDYKTITSI